MTATPAAIASAVEWKTFGVPPSERVPLSAVYAPLRILSSVLLPAPFSPINACTEPSATPNVMPSSARTPGKDLPMLSNSRYAMQSRYLVPAPTYLWDRVRERVRVIWDFDIRSAFEITLTLTLVCSQTLKD